MRREPQFDIFSGESDKDALWLEAVEGLSAARERMEALAAQAPGKYFLFSSFNRSILARVDTTQKPSAGISRAKATGTA